MQRIWATIAPVFYLLAAIVLVGLLIQSNLGLMVLSAVSAYALFFTMAVALTYRTSFLASPH